MKRKPHAPGNTSDPRHKSNQYDRIWRENMQAALPGLIRNVLGLDIAETKVLSDKLLITRHREVDCLHQVTDHHGITYLLHIETQTANDPEMPYRMLEYRAMAQRIYRMPVRQYVIYLGPGKANMSDSIEEEGLSYRYTLVALSDVPYEVFLRSEKAEERLLAVLGYYGPHEPAYVLQETIRSILQDDPHHPAENKYVQQLRVISQLRNLADEFSTTMESVATFFREEKDPYYVKGERKGVEKGLEKGLEKGAARERKQIVRNLLSSGRLTVAEIAEFTGIPLETVKQIQASV